MTFGRHYHASTGRKKYVIYGVITMSIVLFCIVLWSQIARLQQPRSIQDLLWDRWLRILYPFDESLVTAIAATQQLMNTPNETIPVDRLFSFLLDSVQHIKSPLLKTLAKRYPRQFSLLQEVTFFSGDLQSMLGFQKPQTYLIVLQNRAEKRPNGWFFGSFILVTIDQWRILSFEVADSYLPAYHTPGTKILWPTRLEKFLPEREIYFVWANKVWFTYQDGANIKTLYEKSYPGQKIRGVFFLRTDMFEKLLPEFTQQLWHRQYVNASIDLLRGESQRWKKQLYLASLEEFLQINQQQLLINFIKQLPTLIDERLINIYLEDISSQLHTWIRTNHLTTRFEEDHAYFWDSNISYNKSDRFVSKSIILYDDKNQKLSSRTEDIVQLPPLPLGKYAFEITYKLQVPDAYRQFIRALNSEYNIVLTTREEHILALDHTRSSRGVVYFPEWIQPQAVSGDSWEQELFDTPFSHNVMYTTRIDGNNKQVQIRIPILVGEQPN